MKAQAILWTAIAMGPVIWFVNLETNFALAPLACAAKTKAFLYVVSAISLILTAAAAALSYSQWQVAERSASGDGAAVPPWRRAVALAGIGLSGLSFLVICAQTIPNLMLAGCE